MAFTVSVPLASNAQNVRATTFTRSLDTPAAVVAPRRGASMALRVSFVKGVGAKKATFGGVNRILAKADEYMAMSVLKQYQAMTQPSGVYNTSCTEGSVKGAAEATRVRALNTEFRKKQRGAAKLYGDMYENRRMATYVDHLCSTEAKQFSDFPGMAQTYVLARSEAYGTCDRSATPESVEEAAMARYIDIQQKNAVNPSGVYNSSCNEGAAKGQAEDLRVSALAAAYRNGLKPAAVLLQEKFNQRKHGYFMANSCTYEEGLITKFPAIGACFRSKSYGY